MLAGGAAILCVMNILRHFAPGNFMEQFSAQRLLVERDGGRAVAAKSDIGTQGHKHYLR